MPPAASESQTALRVVHVGADVSRGGASTAMRGLHEGLLRRGVASTVVTLQSAEATPEVEIVMSPLLEAQRGLLDFVNAFLYEQRTAISNTHLSPDIAVSAALDEHPVLRSADVIHLHWVAGFLCGQSLLDLAALGKPVFWTLHDLRPLSGGCHFSAGCEKFTTRCVACPQLKADPLRMTERGQEALRIAAAALDIHYIAPSSWLQQCAGRSTVAAHLPVSRVPYGLDAERFSPMEKREARSLLGLRPDAFYLLLGAQNFEEIRKGASAAQDLLLRLAARPALRSKIKSGAVRLACFGTASEKLEIPGWQVDRLGYLADERALRAAYAGSDMLLFTSQEDNLPNVILEAMACGLPVAGFSLGGVPDLIDDGENGLLLNSGDLAGNAARIAEIIEQPGENTAWPANARRKILEAFTLAQQSAAMIDLYQGAVASRARPEFPVREPAPSDVFLEFDSVLQLAAASMRDKIQSAEGRLKRLRDFLKQCRRAPWKLYGKRPSI